VQCTGLKYHSQHCRSVQECDAVSSSGTATWTGQVHLLAGGCGRGLPRPRQDVHRYTAGITTRIAAISPTEIFQSQK